MSERNKRTTWAVRVLGFLCACACAVSLSGCGCRSERENSDVSAVSGTTTTAATTQTTTSATEPTEELTLTQADCRSVGISLAVYYYTAAFAREDAALHEAVAGALSALFADGTVDTIGKRWFHDEVFPRDGQAKPTSDATDGSWKRVQSAGKLIVGADADAAPLSFRTKAGEWQGYEIEVVRAAVKQLGVSVEFRAVAEEDRLSALQNGTVDCLWGGCRYDSDLRHDVLYAGRGEWMLEDSVCYYTKQANTFDGETDLWGMNEVMVTSAGSFSERFIRQRMQEENVRLTLRSESNAAACFRALQEDEAFVVAIDYLSAAHWLA